MYPESACNLLDILPLPPWRDALPWGLHTTSEWEKRILFSSYVKPSTSTACYGLQEQAASFPQFGALAAELQLRILGVCPVPTLFQLMHVSPALRADASQLFWANQSAYFLVEADWLLQGGYPGYQCCDLAFMQNVQNLEIAYPPYINNKIWPLRSDGTTGIEQAQITTFWDSVQRRFPQAKRVVINQDAASGTWRGADTVPPPLQALVQAGPCTMAISTLVPERQPLPNADTSTRIPPVSTWQRSQYQFTTSTLWTKIERKHGKTILLPVRQLPGLVGRFVGLKERCVRNRLEQYGLWPLAIEALDRYHFDLNRNRPFACPLPPCRGYFDKAGAWTVHAAASHYQDPTQFSILPNEIRVPWEERVRVLEESRQQAKKQFSKIWEDWDKAGLEEQSATERAWTEQLEDKTLWDAAGEGVGENKLWRDFLAWARGDI
jgi:uncharacterized protein YbdZ (MbtH family)